MNACGLRHQLLTFGESFQSRVCSSLLIGLESRNGRIPTYNIEEYEKKAIDILLTNQKLQTNKG
jgi:hypothetical protein